MISFILLNLMLFVGSYLAGCIPISFNFPAARLRILTLFGAGLLLGAALVIIIPEGVHSLYSAQGHSPAIHNHDSHKLSSSNDDNPLSRVRRLAEAQDAHLPANGPAVAQHDAIDSDQSKSQILHDEHQHPGATPLPFSFLNIHQHIGIALLFGYLCMLFVDQLGNHLLEIPCCTCLLPGMFSCSRRCCSRATSPVSPTGANGGCAASSGPGTGHQRSTATLGLVIHSFADGLALGAAFASQQVQLELVLFLAIILHKVPAAFGLCCYLIHEGFSRDAIRIHLVLFAAASPLAALLTYGCLAWSSVDQAASQATVKTGFALLLSGGTFLYVAASHILPEIIQTHSVDEKDDPRTQPSDLESPTPSDYTLYTMGSKDPLIVYNKTASGGSNGTRHGASVPHLRLSDLFVLTLGTFIPMLLSLGHSH